MKQYLPYLLIAVSVGLFYVHIDPRYKEVQKLQTQKDEYIAALAKIDELQAQKNQILSVYNALPKSDLARLDRLLPEKLNAVKLVADMDGVAGRYAITIGNIRVTEEAVDRGDTVGGETGGKPYRTTAVSFKFTASYTNMVSFLRDLEKSLQLIDITAISFDVKETKPGEATSNLNEYQVTFQTYSLK
jgi:Tfp pilus assembly protein PilO